MALVFTIFEMLVKLEQGLGLEYLTFPGNSLKWSGLWLIVLHVDEFFLGRVEEVTPHLSCSYPIEIACSVYPSPCLDLAKRQGDTYRRHYDNHENFAVHFNYWSLFLLSLAFYNTLIYNMFLFLF